MPDNMSSLSHPTATIAPPGSESVIAHANTSKSLTGPTISQHPEIYDYLLRSSLRYTKEQQGLLTEIEQLEKANMAGAPEEAQFLQWLCELFGAKKVVEVGVFRGSTTLALAMAVGEGGKVYGLDVSAEWASTGQKYWRDAGVENRISLMIGSAQESMQNLLDTLGPGTMDLIFIDADKTSYDIYYELSLKLLRSGGVVAIDNTLYHGRLEDPTWLEDPNAKSIRQLNEKIRTDNRVSLTMLSIADGLTLCRKL